VSEPRILHLVASRQRRGAEIAAADLIGAMGELGVHQQVATLRGGDLGFPAPTEALWTGWRVPGIRADGGAAWRLRGLLRSWRPDVVHAHGGEAFKHAALATRRIPVAYRRIGWVSPRGRRGLRRAVHARLLRRAAVLICVAEAVARETIELLGVPDDLVVVVPTAIDAGRLRPSRPREAVRRSLGIGPSAKVLLSLGALVWEKDPMAHLAVAERVRREVPSAVHVIAGDGPIRPQVEAAVLDGATRVLGSRRDVADLLEASDLLLLASRSEGLPNVVIEAGLAGLPAVAYDVAGVREVVQHGRTGLVAPAGDIDGLASAAARLLADPEAGRRMGDAARERCRREFEISVVAPRYLDIYRGLAGT
jgi:glycosyltransferase involved in cell wall biosynthesis